ncbi:MAG: hypothetical protein WBC92_05050 [Terracidiphilus sp.]
MITKAKNPNDLGVGTSVLESDARWKLAERVARSSALYRATQLREMLLFIVRQAILNPEEPIHESEIAHRVLGRRSDFNPLDDNIVRVQMAHLRKKLDAYFSTEGKQEDVVITVALGNYKPVFSRRSRPAAGTAPETDAGRKGDRAAVDDAAAEALALRDGETWQKIGPVHIRRLAIVLLVISVTLILGLAACCAALWVRVRDQQQTMNTMRQSLTPWKSKPAVSALWSNFFDTSRDTDLVLSDDSFLLMEQISKHSTPFYGYLNRSYIDQSQSNTMSAETRFIQGMIATKSLGNTSEFKLALRILELDPLGKNIHLYSARQYMPALVKQDNVILIGGRISNPWVELFESRLNFVENTKFEGFGVTTVTNRAPVAGEQATYTSTDSAGYCVVALLPNPGQDGKALLIEGTSAEATEAAGDFLSGEQFSAFRETLHTAGLPYFEVLLKTSQVRGTPLTVTVEAYRVYPALH